jgi:hypothetical protein
MQIGGRELLISGQLKSAMDSNSDTIVELQLL